MCCLAACCRLNCFIGLTWNARFSHFIIRRYCLHVVMLLLRLRLFMEQTLHVISIAVEIFLDYFYIHRSLSCNNWLITSCILTILWFCAHKLLAILNSQIKFRKSWRLRDTQTCFFVKWDSIKRILISFFKPCILLAALPLPLLILVKRWFHIFFSNL